MNRNTARALLGDTLIPAWRENYEEVNELDGWARGKHDDPLIPPRPTDEFTGLIKRSTTPWLRLVLDSLTQGLFTEGYRRSTDGADASEAWRVWQRNQMDARQTAIYRGALTHGAAYATVLPGNPLPLIKGYSARRMLAFYDDPATDEWPLYALYGDPVGKLGSKMRWKLYDDQSVWTFDGDSIGSNNLEYVTHEEHNIGECPVVRYAMLDLDGRSPGEIEPLIGIVKRIDQTNLDRLIVQRFGAFVVRYITGLEKPSDDDAAKQEKMRLAADTILISENEQSKIGSLPASDLEPFLKAAEADIRALAAISQTPPQYLLGHMVNLSAEALSSAESGRSRRLSQIKHSYGESNEQVLRMSSYLTGDREGAEDFEAEVVWADLESQSLAAAADALGKISSQLSVPPQALWERIPGVTQGDVDRWKVMAEEDDAFGRLMARLGEDLEGGAAVEAEPV